MRNSWLGRVVLSLTVALLPAACSGGGAASPGAAGAELTLIPMAVVGTAVDENGPVAGAWVILDDGLLTWSVAADGYFECRGIDAGDHTLFLDRVGHPAVAIPIRLFEGRGLDLGLVRVAGNQVESHSGFDGYLCGFVDEDGDGVNDYFADADGDGICDAGKPYAGYPYQMNQGYRDTNGDGINDRFRDRDGDHRDDADGRACGPCFGWVDADGDGVNDCFADADGDGFCDVTGMPFGQPYGYGDLNGDGVNDRFRDADGDGICDLDQRPYPAMTGWIDENLDGICDRFRASTTASATPTATGSAT